MYTRLSIPHPACEPQLRNMFPELKWIPFNLFMQANIVRDYEDILGTDKIRKIDELLNALMVYCHDPSQNTFTPNNSQSRSTSETESQYNSQSTTSEMESEFQLPEAVLDFIHWAEDPPPPLFTLPEHQLGQFEKFRSNVRAVSVAGSDREPSARPDIGSIAESYYLGIIPGGMNNLLATADRRTIHVYDLLAMPTMTTQEILAEARDVEFCIKTFLLLFGIIRRLAAPSICDSRSEAEFVQFIKSSIDHLFETLQNLQTCIAVCFVHLNKQRQ